MPLIQINYDGNALPNIHHFQFFIIFFNTSKYIRTIETIAGSTFLETYLSQHAHKLLYVWGRSSISIAT